MPPLPPRAARRQCPTLLRGLLGVAAVCALACPGEGAARAPDWMQAQAGASLPEHDGKTTAVLLYAETLVTVQPSGKLRRVERRVYKILRPDGASYGTVKVAFNSRFSRVTSLHAWCIPAGGKDYEVGDREAVESSLPEALGGVLVSEVRGRVLQVPAAVPGSLIGYQVEREDQPLLMTDEWRFQETVPVREAHYRLELPPGWQFRASWLNHSEVSPAVLANTRHWVVTDVPAIRPEPDMPPLEGIAGRMLLSFAPATGAESSVSSWRQIGTWYLELTRGRREASPQIKQQVAELTTAAATPLAKMRALAAFVQNDIRYVAIELGIGGLQPHAAGEVFAQRFGDCKDKATLLSSMLKEIGIDSSYVILDSRRGAVAADTPPNTGFNHVIVAIQLPSATPDPALAAVMTHPRLGQLLFFDPTDPYTPFGSLAGALQGGYGLLVAPEGGELVQLPQLPLERSAVQRTAQMTLDASGTLRGEVHEVLLGEPAARQRRSLAKARQDSDYARAVESHLGDSFASFSIEKATVRNLRALEEPLEWNYPIEVEHYAKSSGDLLVVRPRILGSMSSALLESREPRRYPVEFPAAGRDTDDFQITLPEGYVLDDLPPPVDLDIGLAAYHSKTEVVGHTLRYRRTYELHSLTVPLDKTADLKKLYRTIYGDEHAVAVLRRASR